VHISRDCDDCKECECDSGDHDTTTGLCPDGTYVCIESTCRTCASGTIVSDGEDCDDCLCECASGDHETTTGLCPDGTYVCVESPCRTCTSGAKVKPGEDCDNCVCECESGETIVDATTGECTNGDPYVCVESPCEVCYSGTAQESLVKVGVDCPEYIVKIDECCPEEEVDGVCDTLLDACVDNFSAEDLASGLNDDCLNAFNDIACTAPDNADQNARMLARSSRSTSVAVQSSRSRKGEMFRKLFKTRATALRRKRAAEKKMRKMRRKRRDADDGEEEETKNVFAIMMEGDDKYITTDLIKLCAAVYNVSPIGAWSGSIETLITAGFQFVSDFIITKFPGMGTELPRIDGLMNDDGSALTLGNFLNDTTLLIANGLAKRYNVDDEGASEMLTILQFLRVLADMFLDEFFEKIKDKLDFSAIGVVPACIARNLIQQCEICIDAFTLNSCNTCPCAGCDVPDELCSACFVVQDELAANPEPIIDTFPENIDCNIQTVLDTFSRKVVEAMQVTLESIPIVGPAFLAVRMNAEAVKIVTSIFNSSPLATISKKGLEAIIKFFEDGAKALFDIELENLDAGEGQGTKSESFFFFRITARNFDLFQIDYPDWIIQIPIPDFEPWRRFDRGHGHPRIPARCVGN
jgi:hypothetical protein